MTRPDTARYAARVTKDNLVFSAGHFITFNDTVCERIHGHNWRVDVCVEGQLDANGYVFDFIALRDACHALVNQLDHRMLLPADHPQIHVVTSTDGRSIRVTFADRAWEFPADECVILPVFNTTAELIARWFADELTERLALSTVANVTGLRVSIEENFGQWADCHLSL